MVFGIAILLLKELGLHFLIDGQALSPIWNEIVLSITHSKDFLLFLFPLTLKYLLSVEYFEAK